MKLFLLLLLTAGLAAGAAAQEPQEQPSETTKAQDEPAAAAPEPAENPQLRLGHPLDPADVATLTGRDDAPTRRYAEPMVYLDVPGDYGNLWLDDAPVSESFFGLTGRRHGRRFFMFAPQARTPRIFFPVFNGMFFIPR